MRLAQVALILTLSAVSLVQAQRRGMRGVAPDLMEMTTAKSESEKRILATIGEAVRAGELYANVPAADGKMLRILAESVNAKDVVEIGTSTGISGMWFSLALEKTGGKLTTFEYDSRRAATAREHFRRAGVDRLVTVVQGDAHQTIRRLAGPIDVVFIDADKGGYVDYLEKLLPLVRPGGLILAHNSDMVPEYMRAVTTNAHLETVVYSEGGGLAITMKKR
jgi:caffeoyl-CoA O-methyltransferase